LNLKGTGETKWLCPDLLRKSRFPKQAGITGLSFRWPLLLAFGCSRRPQKERTVSFTIQTAPAASASCFVAISILTTVLKPGFVARRQVVAVEAEAGL
jgi:hypothetical protein